MGTLDSFASAGGSLRGIPELDEDGFWLSTRGDTVQILGQNERGALYGAFDFLSNLAQGKLSNNAELAHTSNPSASIRWVND